MSKSAMGFLECAGYGTALYAMDTACKSADIQIIGIDTINPKNSSDPIPLTVQVKFTGSVSDVDHAVETAVLAAKNLNPNGYVLGHSIKRVEEDTQKLGKINKL